MARRTVNRQQIQHKIQLATPEITDSGTLVARQDARDTWRRRFGRAISMDVIEMAFQAATRGSMSMLADLSRETVDTDPHLASVLQKRFGAVSQLPYEIQAAVGPSIDPERAMWYASVVREQIKHLPDFRDVLFLLAWALFDGRAAFENKWQDIVGIVGPGNERVRWVIRQIDWIHPRRLNFGPYRELRVINETTMGIGGSFAPVGLSLAPSDLIQNNLWRKFIQWCPRLFADYQEREGLAARCLYWSFFKRYSARDRMQLVELFGKPWRILKVDSDSTASETALSQADEILDRLGHSYSARLPRGTDLKVVQPGTAAGETHRSIIDDSDKQISKLVLGQTGTTDGVPAGINSDQAAVMQNEQYMILIRDSQQLGEVVTRELSNAIIELNFGVAAISHAPRFVLRFDQQTDRASELSRLMSTLEAGLKIKVDEAYEISGFTKPDQDDIVLQIDQPPTPPLSPVAPAVRPVVVYPQGDSPPTGEQNPAPLPASINEGASDSNVTSIGSSDIGAIITVNEARDHHGLDPLTLPNGSPDPDGFLTIEEFKKRKAAAQVTREEQP